MKPNKKKQAAALAKIDEARKDTGAKRLAKRSKPLTGNEYGVDYYRTSHLKAEAQGGKEATVFSVNLRAKSRIHALSKAASPHRYLIDAYLLRKPWSLPPARELNLSDWFLSLPDAETVPVVLPVEPEPEPPVVEAPTVFVSSPPAEPLWDELVGQAALSEDTLSDVSQPSEDAESMDGEYDAYDAEDYDDEEDAAEDDLESCGDAACDICYPGTALAWGDEKPDEIAEEPSSSMAIFKIVIGGIVGVAIGFLISYLLFVRR